MQKRRHEEFTWKSLSTYRSQIMGIGIIWVMLFHGIQLYPRVLNIFPLIGNIMNRGMMGVEIFLFVSGIGLYYSFTKEDRIKSFYLKRIDRVLIPYLIISFPFWLWQDIWVGRSVKKFLLDITLVSFWKEGDRTMWYIALILLLYAAYPLLYKLFLKDAGAARKGIFLVGSILLPWLVYWIGPLHFSKIEIAIWRVSSFALGCVAAKWIMESKKLQIWHVLLPAVISAGLIKLTTTMTGPARIPGVPRLMYLPIALFLCLVVSLILKLLNFEWLNKFLGTAGKYSLELYMIHIFVKLIYIHYFFEEGKLSTVQGVIIWLLIMALSALLSVGAHYALQNVGVTRFFKKREK